MFESLTVSIALHRSERLEISLQSLLRKSNYCNNQIPSILQAKAHVEDIRKEIIKPTDESSDTK